MTATPLVRWTTPRDYAPDCIELLRQRIREDAASDLHWPSIILGVLVFGLGLVAVFL